MHRGGEGEKKLREGESQQDKMHFSFFNDTINTCLSLPFYLYIPPYVCTPLSLPLSPSHSRPLIFCSLSLSLSIHVINLDLSQYSNTLSHYHNTPTLSHYHSNITLSHYHNTLTLSHYQNILTLSHILSHNIDYE